MLLTDDAVGAGARTGAADLRDGVVALLDHLRFNPDDRAKEQQFRRQLASSAQVAVATPSANRHADARSPCLNSPARQFRAAYALQ